MSLVNDFRAEMKQSVSIATVKTNGLYGPTYNTATAYSCYVEREVVNILNSQGKEAVSHCQIFLDGAVTVNDTDRVTFGGKTPVVLRIDSNDDDRGNAYSVVIYT